MRLRSALLLALLSVTACPSFDRLAQQNVAPLVDAGEDQRVEGGAVVTLSGSALDAEGDALTWRWRQLQGAGVSLSSESDAEVTFVAPMRNEVLVFELRAHDGFDEGLPDLVQVEIHYNRPPVADPGGPWLTSAGLPLRLRGKAADPEGDAITAWQWSVVGGPAGADLGAILSGADTPLPTFLSPTRGNFTLELRASDATSTGAAAETTVLVENNPPIAAVQVTQEATSVFRLEAVVTGPRGPLASYDPDGDAITGFAWRALRSPPGGSLSFLDATDLATTRVEALGQGVFELELQVTDSEGAQSSPYAFSLDSNRPPVLSLNGLSFVALSGERFGVDASASIDPDGDPVIVLWTKTSGAAGFPDTQVGPTPIITAPSFTALLQSGQPTFASYELVATDGKSDSPPQTITLHVLPSPIEAVVVSDVANADDTVACGSVAVPCQTIHRGLEILTGGTGFGDGRPLLLTQGSYQETQLGPLFWPDGVDLIGAFDPITFDRSPTRPTFISHNTQGICNQFAFNDTLRFPQTGSVRFESVSFQPRVSCAANMGLACNGCNASLVDVEIDALGGGANVALYVTAGGVVSIDRSSLRSTTGNSGTGIALRIPSGQVSVRDSRIEAGGATAYDNYALLVGASGSATIERSTLVTSANDTNGGSSSTIDASGYVSIVNSVIQQRTGGDDRVVTLRQGGSILNSTLVGTEATNANSAVLLLSSGASVANSILHGTAHALWIENDVARQSHLHQNQLYAAGLAPIRCRPAGGGAYQDSADLSTLEGSCNDSGVPWTNNGAGPCPFVGLASGDLHLSLTGENPCLDAGSATSPAGDAPKDDLDGEARPQGAGVDIGADEAG